MTKQNNQSEVKEIWVPAQFIRQDGTLEEHPNYEVSNFGRVKSLNYNHSGKPKVMKPFGMVCPHGTYYKVQMIYEGKKYTRRVHRLVLSSFNSKGYFKGAVVDHRDSNPSNNKLNNLRWTTYKENSNTTHRKALQSKIFTNHPAFSKRVKVTFLDDGHSEIFPSAREVERTLGLPKDTVASYISQRCNHYKKLNLLFEYI